MRRLIRRAFRLLLSVLRLSAARSRRAHKRAGCVCP